MSREKSHEHDPGEKFIEGPDQSIFGVRGTGAWRVTDQQIGKKA
jgi:hypothetical protein